MKAASPSYFVSFSLQYRPQAGGLTPTALVAIAALDASALFVHAVLQVIGDIQHNRVP